MLPLQTVQSTIHINYPSLLDWRFNLINDLQDPDKDIYQYFCWSTDLHGTPDPDGGNALLVAFQPPWILSDQDIKEFSECRSVCHNRISHACSYGHIISRTPQFPPYRQAGNVYPTTLDSQHRVWAKVSFKSSLTIISLTGLDVGYLCSTENPLVRSHILP
jgi:hypothetical protein